MIFFLGSFIATQIPMDGINFGLLKIAAFLSPFFPPLLLRSDTMRSVTKLQQQQHDTSREELPAFYQGLILLKRDFNGLDNLWIWPALTSDSIGRYVPLKCWRSTVFHWLIMHRNHFAANFFITSGHSFQDNVSWRRWCRFALPGRIRQVRSSFV